MQLGLAGVAVGAYGWPQMLGDGSQVQECLDNARIELADGLVLEAELCNVDGSLESILSAVLARTNAGSDPGDGQDEDVEAAGPYFSAWLSAEGTGDRLQVRTPRPGDRMAPLGMAGDTLKLSDLFINAKIPRRLRARWPLVCAGGEIAWVPGLRVSERFRLRGDLPARVRRLSVKKERSSAKA